MTSPEGRWIEHGGCPRYILTDGERELSGVSLIPHRLRIGAAELRCGGIGGVATAEEERRKGYAARCLTAVLARLADEGYHLSLLFGINDFYHRFGFRPVFSNTTLKIATGLLPAAPDGVRGPTAADWPRLRERYEIHAGARPGRAVRPADWSGFRHGVQWRQPTETLVVERGDRVLGHACYRVDEHGFDVAEIIAEPSGYDALAAAVRLAAEAARQPRVQFHLPPDDPFVHHARRWSGELVTQIQANGGPMARLIRLAETIDALLGEFTARLRTGAQPPFTLTLATDLGRVGLAWDGHRLSRTEPVGPVIEVGQDVLGQWLFGYRTVADAALAGAVVVPPEVAAPLDNLFGLRHAYMWWPDRF